MSKMSNRTKGTGAARSVGKHSARDPSSFAQSNASGMTGHAGQSVSGQVGGPNIVIDIESENLTYNQARSIRLQL